MRRALAASRSVRIPDHDRLAALARIDRVVVIGSSCAGKTTLVDAVRGSDLVSADRVDVPTRLITRPPRAADNLVENVHVSVDAFLAEVHAGAVELHWLRHGAGQVIRYGFRRPRAGILPVYSANNAIVSATAGLEPAGALAHALIVGVYAPDPVRTQRLERRSPDLWGRPDELFYRLGDRADRVFDHAHVVIENHGELEQVAPAELVAIVRALVA